MSIRIDGTNTTANPGITGSDTDTGLQFGTNEVKVVTGGSDRVTVDSAGRIGVNQSSPARILHVGSSGTAEANVRIEGGADYFEFRLKDSDNALTIHKNIADAGSSEAVRIQSGGGISFNGDTAAENALDDYEEGSWTPTVTVEGQNAATTDKQNGRYIKIGNKVTVWAYVQLNGTPTGRGVNNAWQHGGLPFPKKNDEGGFDVGGPIMYWTIDSTSALNGTAPYMLVARLFNNSSGGRIRGHDSSGNQSGQNLSLLLKDNTEYAYSFTYETTA